MNNLTTATIPPIVVSTPAITVSTFSTLTPSSIILVIPLITNETPIPMITPPIAPLKPPNWNPNPAPIKAPPIAPSIILFQDRPSSNVTRTLSISNIAPRDTVNEVRLFIKVLDNFHRPNPAPTSPTFLRISPNLVSNNSPQESMSSVIPSHSFISSTISLTLLSANASVKSYSGNLKSNSPPDDSLSVEPPVSGLITLSSSKPSIYDLSFFADSVASSNAPLVSSATPPIDSTPE